MFNTIYLFFFHDFFLTHEHDRKKLIKREKKKQKQTNLLTETKVKIYGILNSVSQMCFTFLIKNIFLKLAISKSSGNRTKILKMLILFFY